MTCFFATTKYVHPISLLLPLKMSALATSSDKQFVIRRGNKDDCPAILDLVGAPGCSLDFMQECFTN